MSYSPIASDPRVLRQIEWLQEAEIQVDVAGLGSRPAILKGEYYQIGIPNLAIRLLLYVFAPNAYRHKKLILDQIPNELRNRIDSGYFDAIHINDLEFVPLIQSLQIGGLKSKNKIDFSIDIHEYFPGVKGGMFWRLFIKNFHNWLFRTLQKTSFNSYSTVSEQIANEYAREFDLPIMKVVWNAPNVSNCNFEARVSPEIKLVYHGNTGKGRPVFRYVRAVKRSTSQPSLHFMITSGAIYLNAIRLFSILIGAGRLVSFHKPVPVKQISQELEQYDVELVWLPPLSRSLHLSLANKFFEAVQAGLGVVIGKSPSMEPLVVDYNIGAISQGWKTNDLVDILNLLDRNLVEIWRQNSIANRLALSSERSRNIFLEHVLPSD
jgi:hypothetical protein